MATTTDRIQETLAPGCLVRDYAPLSFDFDPPQFLHRDAEARLLTAYLKPVILGSVTSRNVIISGPVGTGKTTLARRFCAEAARANKNIAWVHVNCRSNSTEPRVLICILEHLQGFFPDRGFSEAEMLGSIRKHIQKAETRLIVILDEVDVLLKNDGSDVIYHLSRFNEAEHGGTSGISLILISKNDPRSLMEESAASTLAMANYINVVPYAPEAVLDIVQDRVERALRMGAATDVLEQVVSAANGNARLAIELLQSAVARAEAEGFGRVTPTHIEQERSIVQEVERLPYQVRLALLGIVRSARGGLTTHTGPAEAEYRLACEQAGVKPRGHTQFWLYTQDLDSHGLVTARRSGKGMPGSTTLYTLPQKGMQADLERLCTGTDSSDTGSAAGRVPASRRPPVPREECVKTMHPHTGKHVRAKTL